MQLENHPLISTQNVLRPTYLEINLQTIKNNFQKIKDFVGSKVSVMPILKANAYGHGLIRIAKLMEEEGADYLGVAFLEEGILLRENGIKMPILILGGIVGNQIPDFLENDLTITASSIDKITQISETAIRLNKTAKVHLKIDTGMERLGVHYYNAENFIKKSMNCKNVIVEGAFSHFADSASKNENYTRLQLNRFNKIVGFIKENKFDIPLIHIANSGGILQYPEANFTMVRPGILLYGVYPNKEVKKTILVEHALEWKSRVVYFKVIKPNHPVGYGMTWQSKKEIRAVTVPVGYGDGYFRAMSGKAKVLIRNGEYNLIGNISMDQIVVNIGWDSAFNNDEVILIGKLGENEITVYNLAEWANTIPYEILTNINTRVPRVYKS